MLFLAFWCVTRNKHKLRNVRKEGEIWQFLCFGLLTESRCQGRNRWENWPISVQQPGSVIVSVQFLTDIRGEYIEKVLYIIVHKYFIYLFYPFLVTIGFINVYYGKWLSNGVSDEMKHSPKTLPVKFTSAFSSFHTKRCKHVRIRRCFNEFT